MANKTQGKPDTRMRLTPHWHDIRNRLLRRLARRTVARYRPLVVGVTGSVGKSSAVEAIHHVLQTRFRVHRTLANLNDAGGLAISAMAIPIVPETARDWLRVACRALWTAFGRVRFPQVLVLEYGIVAPGEMAGLLAVVRPDVAVLTGVAPSHLRGLGTLETIAREKTTLLAAVADRSRRIVNADLAPPDAATTYACSTPADFRARNIVSQITADGAAAIRFTVATAEGDTPCELRGCVGHAPVGAALAAVAVGRSLGIGPRESAAALATLVGAPRRMEVRAAVNGSVLIDDTFNAAPVSMAHALATAAGLPAFRRRWAVLGDMLDLGDATEGCHRDVGARVAQLRFDRLVTIGPGGRTIAAQAMADGLAEAHVRSFAHAEEAAPFLRQHLAAGDLVLAKGSCGMNLRFLTRRLRPVRPGPHARDTGADGRLRRVP